MPLFWFNLSSYLLSLFNWLILHSSSLSVLTLVFFVPSTQPQMAFFWFDLPRHLFVPFCLFLLKCQCFSLTHPLFYFSLSAFPSAANKMAFFSVLLVWVLFYWPIKEGSGGCWRGGMNFTLLCIFKMTNGASGIYRVIRWIMLSKTCSVRLSPKWYKLTGSLVTV